MSNSLIGVHSCSDSEFTTLKHEYDTAERELRTLRETYNTKQDQWIKDKLDMEEKVRSV